MTTPDAQARAQRGTVFAEETGDLPGVGAVTYRYRNSDLALVEDKLLELGQIEVVAPPEDDPDGEPVRQVLQGWDAIEAWATVRPFRLVPVLIYAGLRHADYTVEDLDEAVPPSALTDLEVVKPMLRAMSKALGKDPDEAPKPPNRAARRQGSKAQGKGRAGSTGGRSSTAGQRPPRPADSARTPEPSATSAPA